MKIQQVYILRAETLKHFVDGLLNVAGVVPYGRVAQQVRRPELAGDPYLAARNARLSDRCTGRVARASLPRSFW